MCGPAQSTTTSASNACPPAVPTVTEWADWRSEVTGLAVRSSKPPASPNARRHSSATSTPESGSTSTGPVGAIPGKRRAASAAEIRSTAPPAAASAPAMAPTVASSPSVTWPVTWRSRRPVAASRSRQPARAMTAIST